MRTSGREDGVRRRAALNRAVQRGRRRLRSGLRPWLGRKEQRDMLIAALVFAAAAGLFLGAGPPLLAGLLDDGERGQAARAGAELAAHFFRDRSGL